MDKANYEKSSVMVFKLIEELKDKKGSEYYLYALKRLREISKICELQKLRKGRATDYALIVHELLIKISEEMCIKELNKEKNLRTEI